MSQTENQFKLLEGKNREQDARLGEHDHNEVKLFELLIKLEKVVIKNSENILKQGEEIQEIRRERKIE